MKNLFDELNELLKEDDRLWADGKLLKNQVIEFGLKPDPGLLKLLLSHERLKTHFFVDVDGVMVFDKDKFIRFANNKAFLPDSYTSFKNKIGLTVDGQFLSERRDVVLSWPYKDCVLEGGQTKEDQKRSEVFWNELLAPDEIDRLLEPKVLTGFKRFEKDGDRPVIGFRDDDNLIMIGNNLLALHSIEMRFSEKVKLIYIDPPYNSGNDGFQYNDSFGTSTWLTFLKNRLEISKKLLQPSGIICVQISDKQVHRLQLLLDEIFDERNFINKITVKTRSPSGFKTVNLGVFESAEYLLIYGKDKTKWKYDPQYEISSYDSNYRYVIENIDNPPIDWEIDAIDTLVLRQLDCKNLREARKKFGDKVIEEARAEIAIINRDSVFRFTTINNDAGKETLSAKNLSLKSPDKVFVVSREDYPDRYVLNGQEISFYSKKVREIDGKLVPTKMITNIWTDIPWEGIASEGGVKLKKGKKPEKLIRRLLSMATVRGDIVLDYFLGSGTTAAVAHKMDRQYIGMEQLEYEDNDGVTRLKNVINGDASGISKLEGWEGGRNFIYCELMSWNEHFVRRILNTDNKQTLAELWTEIQGKAFLSYRLDVSKFDENTKEFNDLSLEDQKRFLMEVLDKNQLYVNLSEIDDETYAVSEEDKRLNRLFYGLD